MITGMFGVPGCGKTTFLAKFAHKELKKISKGKSKYKYVFTNFYCAGCYRLDFKQLNNYKVYDSLILNDEISLDADNREYKSFGAGVRNFLILHRHLNNDLIYFTQDFGKVDKVIRALTNDLWYVSKSVAPLLNRFSVARRIYRQISINEFTSELTLGYRFSTFFEALFVSNKKIVYRPFYYKYFDSYDELQLTDIPILPLREWSDG